MALLNGSNHISVFDKQPQLNISMSAQQVIAACQSVPANTKIFSSIISDNVEPEFLSDSFYPLAICKPDNFLSPLCLKIKSKTDAFDNKFQNNCFRHPMVLIENLPKVLKISMFCFYCMLIISFFHFLSILDFGLFTTKTLVESHPNFQIEQRKQIYQLSDENFSKELNRHVWLCQSSASKTTIAKFAQYQATSFSASFKKKKKKVFGFEANSNSNIPK